MFGFKSSQQTNLEIVKLKLSVKEDNKYRVSKIRRT